MCLVELALNQMMVITEPLIYDQIGNLIRLLRRISSNVQSK